MQNNTEVFNLRVFNQKHAIFLLFSFMSLTLALPALASDAVKPESQSKLLDSKLSKKTKIKTINDLRVIVDISGSMKKTDPNNLRRPAVRLLAGLIPAGSKAGIWNFGKQVNMTVKIGTVNEAWREQARKQSKEINSVGLYTNIESAMRKVSFDWKKPDPRYKRNLILLTDGHVDIGQDDKQDKASRKRILKEIIPALEKAKVRVHTIALSDDVDERLLSTLSSYTDGLYRKVSSADDLQKLFLQMLEQSVKLDTIPLKDNRFNVDANINDMTLLVFNKDKAHPTTIVTPGKRTWSVEKNSNEVKWFSDEGFDLITIKKPQQGQWKIMAPVDKNNRVVVATNLKLKISDMPSFAMLGDVLKVNAQLIEDGKPLTDKRLLSKFKFTLKRTGAGSDQQQYPMSQLANDRSTYSVQLPPIFKSGNSAFVIQAKSPTVEREVNHQLTVYNVPATVKISKVHGKFQIAVTPQANLLRPDSIRITSELEDKNKYIMVQDDKQWLFNVDAKYKGTMFTLNIDGIRADGKPISVNFNKIIETSGKAQALMLEVKKEPEHAKKIVKEHKKEKKKKQKDKEKKQEEADINWTVIILSIVVGNILLVVLFGGGYIFMRRRKEKLAASIDDEMNDDDVKEGKE